MSRLPVAVSSRRVLVVDDEPLIGRAVQRILGNGHAVVVAGSALEALRLLGTEPMFDVLLCDLMMPEMTGMDLYRKLLGERPDDARRMIFLTGGAFTDEARAFLDETPNLRLEKPFEVQLLRGLVNGAAA